MNRRQFFGMTAAAVAAAGLPALVLPEKSYFLAPKYGWQPARLSSGYMREVSQYLIHEDRLAYRYDAIGCDLWGTEHQFHVDFMAAMPEMAAQVIERSFQREGLIAISPQRARHFKLQLPRDVAARYV